MALALLRRRSAVSSAANGIAASVSQANLQQSQVARSRDANKNERAERSRKMRQTLEDRLTRIDDSTAIDPTEQHNEQRENPSKQQSQTRADQDDRDDDQNPPTKHVDVTA